MIFLRKTAGVKSKEGCLKPLFQTAFKRVVPSEWLGAKPLLGYRPTVQPFAQLGTPVPAPAPVAAGFSVNKLVTSAALSSVFFPTALVPTFSNRTLVAFSDPSAT